MMISLDDLLQRCGSESLEVLGSPSQVLPPVLHHHCDGLEVGEGLGNYSSSSHGSSLVEYMTILFRHVDVEPHILCPHLLAVDGVQDGPNGGYGPCCDELKQ